MLFLFIYARARHFGMDNATRAYAREYKFFSYLFYKKRERKENQPLWEYEFLNRVTLGVTSLYFVLLSTKI